MDPLAIPTTERGLASLTHLSGLAGYLVPFGGMIVPIVIWAVKRDSAAVSKIAKQAILLNVTVYLLGLVGVALMFTVILIPISFALWLVLAVVALVLPIVGAIKANDGFYYRYPLIGALLD